MKVPDKTRRAVLDVHNVDLVLLLLFCWWYADMLLNHRQTSAHIWEWVTLVLSGITGSQGQEAQATTTTTTTAASVDGAVTTTTTPAPAENAEETPVGGAASMLEIYV